MTSAKEEDTPALLESFSLLDKDNQTSNSSNPYDASLEETKDKSVEGVTLPTSMRAPYGKA